MLRGRTSGGRCWEARPAEHRLPGGAGSTLRRMGQPAVAVWQMAPVMRSPARNLARLRSSASSAAARGATLLVTPELALTGYDIGDLGDDLTSASLVDDAAAIAREEGIGLIVGVALREEPEGVTWNAAVAIDRAGTICAAYRKVHLFGGLDRSRFAPGPAPPAVVQVDGLRVGIFPASADVGPADADTNPDSAALAWRNGVWVANGNLVPRHFGLPTVTVPLGLMADIGMPVGVTLLAEPYADTRLLQLASAISALRDRRVAPPLTPQLT
ncbi:nitrilase-related carbon-nitrogen hydrolase [Nostocoides jenkinsii]|nr:nitrilase-related carbon-nitrogen hydrolase [Tetrasphaera jenkinsii]